MVRKVDKQKIEKILKILVKYPDGLWIRKLSRETNLAPSTIEYYIHYIIFEITESIGVKDKNGKYFGLRIIKLKPKILETIKKEGFKKIYEFLEFSKKI